jgi:hypothetical protein
MKNRKRFEEAAMRLFDAIEDYVEAIALKWDVQEVRRRSRAEFTSALEECIAEYTAQEDD